VKEKNMSSKFIIGFCGLAVGTVKPLWVGSEAFFGKF
jgi:hypothetical protein